ncbi:Anthranilate synthase [Liberibacter crescens BT-1]|uniref:Anthranilate synthase n=1 Tax=Liberibacter crescens (strain BT-1) TaxID=1215343 RepID=L0EWR0_LIBCB|nr:Anthranilate synthase [Liberibacter crescens BT-1]
MNTGLTLRTMHIKNGIAEVRVGATLLSDSNPDKEETETELKASALLSAIRNDIPKSNMNSETHKPGKGLRILFIDHEDSFVHTLANYFRQTGAEVLTIRTPISQEILNIFSPHLSVLSPGPGMPDDFNCKTTINMLRQNKIPIFGVCLGLQAIAEAYGSKLRYLPEPIHGKPSTIYVQNPGIVFAGLNNKITVGRYHSICIDPDTLPKEFIVTAKSEDGTIMGIEHINEPISAVQFHPESIMTLGDNAGMLMIRNIVSNITIKNTYPDSL